MTYLLLIASILVGVLFVYIKPPNKQQVQLLVSFSGAYLLSMTVVHLLPEVFENSQKQTTNIGVFVLVGILIQVVLETFSKGAEHGHIHIHLHDHKFPWALFLSLCVHAFSEGVPLAFTDDANFLWAIVIHNLPIGILLTSFFLKSNYSLARILLFMGTFSLMSPLGNLLGTYMPMLKNYQTEINAFIIGIFLHISTVIIFESSSNHKFNYKKFITIVLGMAVSILTL